jgi:histone acetyltransferase
MMRYFKTVIQSIEIYDILTCADNLAIDYFKKQGFSDRRVMMDPARYIGRLKEYTQVTLVYCRLMPEIDYLKFAARLEGAIRLTELKIGRRFRPALFDKSQIWRRQPGAPTFLNWSLPNLLELTDCQGREDTENRKMDDYEARMSELKEKCLQILEELQTEVEVVAVFRRPVTEAIAPHYFERIEKPMDFQTIERRLHRFPDYYKRPSVFAADVMLMVENCKEYNEPETAIYKIALQTQRKFRHLYQVAFPECPVGGK